MANVAVSSFSRGVARSALVAALAAVFILFAALAPGFLSGANLLSVLVNNFALLAIVAIAMTFAVSAGGIDLSVGTAVDFSSFAFVSLVLAGQPVALAALGGLAGGALVGLFNAVLIAGIGISPFLATLGTLFVGRSVQQLLTNGGNPVYLPPAGVPEAFLQLSLGRWLFGIPNNIVIMAAVLGGLWILVERTALGQEIQAVGGNPAAARLAGINVDRIKILGFMVSGMCAALTGILLASRLGSGTTSAADSYLLTAFAAVFLGSATMRDGEFHVLGTFVGVLIIAFGFNGLNIFGAPTFSQYIFQGAILIVAVGLASLGRMISES